jgi:hypothetical protein
MFVALPETPPAISQLAPVAALSDTEVLAVRIGVMDGNAALERARRWGFLRLFVREHPRALADTKLETLRTYAELARVLWPKPLPFTSLLQAGFSRGQIDGLTHMLAVSGAKAVGAQLA